MALDNNTVLNYTDKTTIRNWFKTGLKPTQTQFWSTWDSYWHKSESLPISSITNLGNLLDAKAEANHTHSQYATNDATSLTLANVTAWQKKLGVADLKFDDKAITITQDYTEFSLEAGASINAFNNAVYTELQKKLDVPTENATNEYVLLADGSTAAKGDLGKNFANTDLNVIENRKHTGTASVEFGFPFTCSNASVRYSGLLDKSADATYNQLLGVDSNGNAAKVGLNAVTNAMLKSTDAQKDAFRLASRKSTEGYSVGVPRVDYILPNIIANNKDEITYVSVVGLNLLLNLQDCEVRLINVSTNQEYLVSVIQTIAQSSSMFSFGFNFFNKPVGDYKIFVRNGSQTNIDTTVFTLVESISTEPLAVNFNRYFKEGLSEAYKDTFTTGVNYISKNRDTEALGNTPIADFVSETPIVIDSAKDFVFTCLFTINTSASGYLGDAQLGLTQGFVENIFNTVQYGVKFGYVNLISSLTSKLLVTNLLNSSKQIQIQIIKRGSILSIVTSVDGVYSSDVTTVNIVNPLYFIFKNNSSTGLGFVTANPIIINLLSLQYLN